MNVILILCDTLRRDHVGAYTGGRPLNECRSDEAPPWAVPTRNMDRLAARGTTFTHCWCGSTPCMPARRDIYTGRYEFPFRGWGPLEESDRDLPRQVSGPPNRSVRWTVDNGYKVSYLVTDHFHLWEQGSGNYHMGYTGFDFVRGCEADAWHTDPIDFASPEGDRLGKCERHWRNVHLCRKSEADYFCAQTVRRACDWLTRNAAHEDFFLHLDIFDPHEPWDPPEELIRMFDRAGASVEGVNASAPYAPWRGKLSEEQFTNLRARYAAKVVFLDRQLGRLFDTLDRLDLWKDTVVILTADHGTFNGDHGRMGKLQTHEFGAVGQIPLIVAHPELGRGERRGQLVQLVDLYPTVLEAVGRPGPDDVDLHGVSLLPALADAGAATRDHAIAGQFGKSVTITDGRWTLHQSPSAANGPLFWYGYCPARFLRYDLGPVVEGRREVRNCDTWPEPTWLSDKRSDPNERVNLAPDRPEKLHEMQLALRDTLMRIGAPAEQLVRLGLDALE